MFDFGLLLLGSLIYLFVLLLALLAIRLWKHLAERLAFDLKQVERLLLLFIR
jgi:hypothetical protein